MRDGDTSDPATGPAGHKRLRGYLWGTLAVLSCPCHLPLVAAVLAGTSFGAVISEHWAISAVALTGLFVISAAAALHAFRARS